MAKLFLFRIPFPLVRADGFGHHCPAKLYRVVRSALPVGRCVPGIQKADTGQRSSDGEGTFPTTKVLRSRDRVHAVGLEAIPIERLQGDGSLRLRQQVYYKRSFAG